MKKRKLLSGLALAVLITLGLAGKAQAQTYNCTTNPPPPSSHGNVIVDAPTGDCTLGGLSTDSGSITITVHAGSLTTGALQATGDILASAANTVTISSLASSGGSLSINGNIVNVPGTSTAHAIATLSATNDLTTGAITITPTMGGALAVSSSAGSVTTGALQTTPAAGTVNSTQLSVYAAKTITVNGAVTIGGFIDIAAPQMVTTSTTANTIKITGPVSSAQNDLVLRAGGNILSGTLTSFGGEITVHANIAATPTTSTAAFSTGSAGVNGVNGVVNATGTVILPSGGAGIYITNGGTGGIAISKGTDLSAKSNSQSPNFIIVDACNEQDDLTCVAPLTIGSGAVVSDGTSTLPAGGQLYIAKTITLTSTTMSAKDTAPAAGHPEHYAILAAETVTLKGTGLTITANGAQPPPGNFNAAAQINNQGANCASDGFAPPGAIITVCTTGPANSPMTIKGPGALTINGSGANAHIAIQGSPLTFDATLGKVTINANDATAVVGILSGTGTALSFNQSAPMVINSNGKTAGGNAGIINIFASQLTQPVVPSITLSVNGTKKGNAGRIALFPGTGNIALGTGAGQFAMNAKGGAVGGGNGGDIAVSPSGTITLKTDLAVDVSVPGLVGDGGTVSLSGLGFAISGSNLTMNADGGTQSGNGGSFVFFCSNADVIVGTGANAIALSAKSRGTSNTKTNHAGSIEIGFANNITVAGGSLALDAAGNSKGGTINLHDLGMLTVTGTLKVDGKGDGDAGTITIVQMNTFNTMTLDGATISASGDPLNGGTGKGKPVNINALGTISMVGTTIKSNGGGDGGDAGAITIVTSISPPIDITKSASISAAASPTGSSNGGTVSINKAANPTAGIALDVNAFIQVNAGANAPNTANDGKIVLNGVTCQQLLTTFKPDYPLAYWNCTNPPQPGVDEAPAAVATTLGSARTILNDHNSQIYVFTSVSAWQAFFAIAMAPDDPAGATFRVTPLNTIYSSVFEITGITDVTIKETTSHELGHAVDIGLGQTGQSGSPDYTTYVQHDFLMLDYTIVGSSDPTSPRRKACSTNNSAPFDNSIDDSTGSPFCGTGTGYTIIPGTTVGIEDKYAPGGVIMRNSAILQMADSHIFVPSANGTYKDLFAQAFAYEGYVAASSPPSNFDPTSNGVMGHAQFNCTETWALDILSNISTPPVTPPDSCIVVPVWYPPLIGH